MFLLRKKLPVTIIYRIYCRVKKLTASYFGRTGLSVVNEAIFKALESFLGYNGIESGELPKGQDTRLLHSHDFGKQLQGFEHSANIIFPF